MKKVIFSIIGPTYTGKSKLAIDLSLKYPFEIISADSRLVYKGMDIGTSKPTLEERKNIPHYMIDLVEPNFNYSVGLYKKEAESLINNVFLRNKIPLFVGGTGLYLNSVLLGLSIPEINADLSFRQELKNFTQDELYQRLQELDPEACKLIHNNDNFRTIRALEIIYKTNELYSKQRTVKTLPYDVFWIGLSYKDKNIYLEKIKNRTKDFCKNGFIEEVKFLLNKYGELDLFKNTIGYKEAINHIKGKTNKEKLIEEITLHTRQFAKRQMTWFRLNKNINWIYLDDISYKSALDKAFSLIEDISFANTSKVSVS